jgi:hypothetical protein
MYRFGELNVARVRRILAGDITPESRPRRANRRNSARGVRTATCSRRCATLIASWRATSAATRWACCRRSKRWIRCVCMGASITVGTGAAPRAAARGSAARGERHRRQHVRSQRHHRPGGDGLQPAADRPRGPDSRQQHHGDDRSSGTSRHGPDSRSIEPTGKVSSRIWCGRWVSNVHVIDPSADPASVRASW